MSDRLLELLHDPQAPPMSIDEAAVVDRGRGLARRRALQQMVGVGAGVSALVLAYAALPHLGSAAGGQSAPDASIAVARPASAGSSASHTSAPGTATGVTGEANCPVVDTMRANAAWDLDDGRLARLSLLVSDCGVSARLVSPGLGGYVVGALPDQPVAGGLPTAAFGGTIPLADRDGGGFGSLPVIIAPRADLPEGLGSGQVVDLGRGWAAQIGALVSKAGSATETLDGTDLTVLRGRVLGSAGPTVDYPDITATQTFPFTVDGQDVNVTTSIGTLDAAPGRMDHIVVNPAGVAPAAVEMGASIATFTPSGRGPAVWAAQSGAPGTTAPWAILGVASSGIDRLRVDYQGISEEVTARPLGDTGYVIYLTLPRPGLADSPVPPVLTPLP